MGQRVWICGAAPGEKAEAIDAVKLTPWCEGCKGGRLLRAALGNELVENVSLANAVDYWPGRIGNKDKLPPASEGVSLLEKIASTGTDNSTKFVLLIGITYWKSVLNLMSQNMRKSFAFYNDPLKKNASMQGGYNVVSVRISENKTVMLQLEFLPHTNFWCEPKPDEDQWSYVERTASVLADNTQLDIGNGDFEAAIRATIDAAKGSFDIDERAEHWDQDPNFSL